MEGPMKRPRTYKASLIYEALIADPSFMDYAAGWLDVQDSNRQRMPIDTVVDQLAWAAEAWLEGRNPQALADLDDMEVS
jgi:hypothetical protein